MATASFEVDHVYDLESTAASVLILEGLAIHEMRSADRRRRLRPDQGPAIVHDRRTRRRRRATFGGLEIT